MTIKAGVIHGRFQVLHHDHVKYLMAGKAQCDHLIIGITNPEPEAEATSSSDYNRDRPLANPLTYYERYLLIRAVMLEQGVAEKDFSIVPLPIHHPQRYGNYVPLEAVFFLTIYDQWGRQKQAYFDQLGLTTFVLWEVPLSKKGISANDIRELMIKGKKWEHLVPTSVAELLKAWNIPDRLIQIELSSAKEKGAPSCMS